jgi:hypothetical protein
MQSIYRTRTTHPRNSSFRRTLILLKSMSHPVCGALIISRFSAQNRSTHPAITGGCVGLVEMFDFKSLSCALGGVQGAMSLETDFCLI